MSFIQSKIYSRSRTNRKHVGLLFRYMFPREQRTVYRGLISYTKSVSSRSCATGWKTRARRRIPSKQAVSSELANTLPAAQHERRLSLQTHTQAVVKARKAGEWLQFHLLCNSPSASWWSTGWLLQRFWCWSFCQREMELLPVWTR